MDDAARGSVLSGMLLSVWLRSYYKRIWGKDVIVRGLYSLLAVIAATAVWSFLKMEVASEADYTNVLTVPFQTREKKACSV